MKLYFVGKKDSEEKNSWLAVCSMREAAEEKMSELSDKGACCVVEKNINMNKRKKK